MGERGAPTGPSAVRSFLVADIRGYSSFTSAHGDEAASRLTGVFAEIVAEAAQAWSGALVELRGDEALLAFDSPRQALRAAVELQSAFADEERGDPDLPLHVGIGLDAGEAVPVDGGYRGSALNLAARLCAASGPGQIHASSAIVHLAGTVEQLSVEEVEPLELKGFDAPVRAFLVGGRPPVPSAPVVTASPDLQPSAELAPALDTVVPLAGRADERRWLAWHWRRARNGHGRTVVILGPPGIGKTRLCADLAAKAQRDGASVDYTQAGRGAADHVLARDGRPRLVILDDLDAARAEDLTASIGLAEQAPNSGTLVVITHRTEASSTVTAAVARVAAEQFRHELGPLDLDATRSIAAIYAGEDIDRMPLAKLYEESQGHPASIHRLAHAWSRRMLVEGLHRAAAETASERDALQRAERVMADRLAAFGDSDRRARGLRSPEEVGQGAPEAGADAAICPYRGLAPYGTADAANFCGRDRLVAEMVTRLVGAPFVGILGASGSGKSSAILAGLLPALAAGVLPGSDRWPQLVMRPGRDALRSLDRALQASFDPSDTESTGERLDAVLDGLATDQRLVLVVDQFEETFTEDQPAESAQAFVELVCGEHPRLTVVAAMRADRLEHVAAYPALARAMTHDQVLVGPLTTEELRDIIMVPAHRAGLRVEPALVEAMVDDARDRRAILPLLSTTLLELWRQRDGDTLTMASYRLSGGLDGAIARMAEATWAGLDDPGRTAARFILLRLAGSGEGDEVLRRTASVEEFDLDADPAASAAFAALVEGRLLVVDDGSVEVIHEALFREWPRLRGWLEDDAAGRHVQVQLMAAARQWDEDGRDRGDLYRGARLATALDWAREHVAELNAVERAFLEEGEAVARREVEAERRTNRRLRLLLAGTLVFLAVSVVAGVVALVAARQADEQRLTAEQSALVSSAVALLDDDPGLAKVLLVSAADKATPTSELLAAMQAATFADRVMRRVPLDRDPEGSHFDLPFVDARPDGAVLAVSAMHDAPGTSVDFLDALTGELIRPPIVTPPGTITSQARYTPDGTRVVMGIRRGRSPAVSVQRPGAVDPQRYPVNQDDAAGAVGEEELGIVVLSATDGHEDLRLPLGRCGALLSDVSDDHVLAVELLDDPHADHDGGVENADGDADDPDADTADDADELLDDPATDACDWDRGPWALVLLSLSDGSKRTLTTAPLETAWSPGLSRDGRFVIFDDLDRWVTAVYRIDPWSKVFEHELLGVRSISDDGALLLTGRGLPFQPLEVWDVAAGERLSRYAGLDFVSLAEFERGSDVVAATGNDGRLHRWDAHTGEVLQSVTGAGDLRPFPAGPDALGVPVATTSEVAILSVSPHGSIGGRSVSCERADATFIWLNDNALTAAGTDVVVDLLCGAGIGETVVFDPLSGTVRHRWEAGADNQRSVSGDGRYLARQEAPAPYVWGDVVIRDLESGEIVRRMDGLRDWTPPEEPPPGCPALPVDPGAADGEGVGIRVADIEWSPDGRHLAVLDEMSCSVLVWAAATGDLEWYAWPGDREPTSFYTDMAFDADGDRLYLSRPVEEGGVNVLDVLDVHDAATGALLDSAVPYGDRPPYMGIVGTVGAGEDLLVLPGGHYDGLGLDLVWIDRERLDESGPSIDDIHASPVRAWALSADGSLLATGSNAGQVRVWDLSTRKRVAEFDITIGDANRSARGLAWLGESELAVVSQAGEVIVTTIDPGELTAATHASITRAPTPDQCARFGLDPCPTLEELRARVE